MNTTELTRRVKDKAHELGFVLAGVTTPDPPQGIGRYQRWLQAGRHAKMAYLATPRAVERRADPRRILPECRSILVLAVPYDKPQAQATPGNGRIAAYALGEDYHEALKPRLQAVVAFIEEVVGHDVPNRWYTDSGPILERELAQRAGLGWIGKNSMLIHPQHGSTFLLAEILLGIDLAEDAPLPTDHCGTCRRCIEACPTDCILLDRTLDASRCISYLTIELKGSIPNELRSPIGDWVFGCDICQQVCPWNERFAPVEGDAAFSSQQPLSPIVMGLNTSVEEFNRRFKTSPVKRSKRRGYLRNLAVAAGNSHKAEQVEALVKLLNDEKEPLARGHAAWALGQIGGQPARQALLDAQGNETDEQVKMEIEAALEVLG